MVGRGSSSLPLKLLCFFFFFLLLFFYLESPDVFVQLLCPTCCVPKSRDAGENGEDVAGQQKGGPRDALLHQPQHIL